ncbi:MAG TPA: hypothetical protein VG963_22900, partial [Polyangiaceae bacterium]|nr:hypothetical protein [Polyangiaceae bacterium]
MMYDPFARGQYPVGVRSAASTPAEPGQGAPAPLELWYPAASRHRGQDLAAATQDHYTFFGMSLTQEAVRDAAPAAGVFPLVVFSHGIAGHRRQSTFFCTHLASHGYLVAAPDHGGNALSDLLPLALRARSESLHNEIAELMQKYVVDRARDLRCVLDASASGALAFPVAIAAGVALTGHSL